MRNESNDWRAWGCRQWFFFLFNNTICLLFVVPHREELGKHPGTHLDYSTAPKTAQNKHDSIIFNQRRLLAKAIIAKVHYSIYESITILLNGTECVQRLSKVHCTIVWLRKFLAFIVSSGKPLMNTVRAARVETRKLKQTHLWSHTMTDVVVVVVLVVCVCEVRMGGVDTGVI